MKRNVGKKSKIAVLVTAVLLSAILILFWITAAFLTVNNVKTSDYSNFSKTKLVSFSGEKLTDGAYYGIAFYADDTTNYSSTARKIFEAGKVAFVFLPSMPEDRVLSVLGECMSGSTRKKLAFCSADRNVLETLLTEDPGLFCILLTTSPIHSYFGAKMGYNCALPVDKLTEKRVQRAHDNDHIAAATDVKHAQLDTLSSLQVDLAFLVD